MPNESDGKFRQQVIKSQELLSEFRTREPTEDLPLERLHSTNIKFSKSESPQIESVTHLVSIIILDISDVITRSIEKRVSEDRCYDGNGAYIELSF